MPRPDGVLAVCIDPRELLGAAWVLDEMFGETNRLAFIHRQKTTPRTTHRTYRRRPRTCSSMQRAAAPTGKTELAGMALEDDRGTALADLERRVDRHA